MKRNLTVFSVALMGGAVLAFVGSCSAFVPTKAKTTTTTMPTVRSMPPSTSFGTPSSPTGLFSSLSPPPPQDPTPTRRRTTTETTTAAAPKPFLLWLKERLPPTPEDQLILIGDIGSMFVYAFTSHTLHSLVVKTVLDTSPSLESAAQALDADAVRVPVWLDMPPDLADRIVGSNLEHAAMNHWGPLFSSAGLSAVVLSSCWILAGYCHRTFLFDNTLACDTERVLQKTVQTWISAAVMMAGLAWVSNQVVQHQMPVLETWLGCTTCRDYLFTKADTYYIVDSLTLLLLWRFMISTLLGYGKK